MSVPASGHQPATRRPYRCHQFLVLRSPFIICWDRKMNDERRTENEERRMEEERAPAGGSGRLFPRSVLLLSFASFFNDVASELLLKIGIPLYVVFLLEDHKWAILVVGLIDGTAETIATFLQFITGWWADRTGRR